MITPCTSQKRKLQEKTRLLAHAKMLAAKIAEVQDEMMVVQAHSYHLFTLVFVDGQGALLEIWGAGSREEATRIAHTAVVEPHPQVVLEGDHPQGKARIIYHWCSRLALVVNARMMSRHLEGPSLHIVLFGDETRSEEAKG